MATESVTPSFLSLSQELQNLKRSTSASVIKGTSEKVEMIAQKGSGDRSAEHVSKIQRMERSEVLMVSVLMELKVQEIVSVKIQNWNPHSFVSLHLVKQLWKRKKTSQCSFLPCYALFSSLYWYCSSITRFHSWTGSLSV